MLRTSVVCALAVAAPAVVAQPLSVASGTAITFAVAGTPPRPGPARRMPIGPANPGVGEITVGLAPAGNAVGVAKLHVYERTSAPIDFEVTAMREGKPGATETVCGRPEMDVWVTFPAGTHVVRLSRFVTAKPGCQR